MDRFFRFFQRISIFIVVIVPVLAMLYFILWQEIIRDVFPLPVSIRVINILGPLLVGGSLLFWLASVTLGASALKKKNPTIWGITIFSATILSVSMFFISSIGALSPKILSSSGEMNNHHYYAVVQIQVGDMNVPHSLYKCNEKDMDCTVIFEEVAGGFNSYPTQLIVDQRADEIHFFMGRWLQYTDGPIPHGYEVAGLSIIDIFHYYLWKYKKNSIQEFVITRCDGETLDNVSCAILPFRYSIAAYNEAEIVADKSSKEIKLLIDGRPIFTYDTAPHCLVEGCVIVEE